MLQYNMKKDKTEYLCNHLMTKQTISHACFLALLYSSALYQKNSHLITQLTTQHIYYNFFFPIRVV